MSLSSLTNRSFHTGDGSTETYSYGFKIFDDDELLVTIRDTEDEETTLTKTTHYTVTGVGNAAGGNVVLVNGSFAWLDSDGDLKTDYVLCIRRKLALTQPTDFRNQGDFYPEGHEDQFDRLVMICQQLQYQLDRCIRGAETDTSGFGATLPIASERANTFLAFDADGNPIASDGGIDDSLPVSAFIETLLDDANAAAARNTLGASGGVWPASVGGTGLSSLGSARQILRVNSGATALEYVNNGSLVVTAKTATFTAAVTDDFYPCDATSGAITANLPAASAAAGKVLTFKKTDTSANAVTLDGNGSETIDGATTYVLRAQYDWVRIASDGSNWRIIDRYLLPVSANCTDTAGTTRATGSTYTIAFATETFDTHGAMSAGVFTAPRAGKYLIQAGLKVDGVINGGAIALFARVDGTTTWRLHGLDYDNANSRNFSLQGSVLLNLTAGQTVDIRFEHGGGANLVQSNSARHNTFSVVEQI